MKKLLLKNNFFALFIGLFIVASSMQAVTYTYIGGSVTDLSSWTNGGTPPATFANPGDIWLFDGTVATANLNSTWGISSTATVELNGNITLTYASGASIGNAFLRMNGDSKLILNINANFLNTNTSLNSGTVVYGAGTSSVAGDNYFNLEIDNNVATNNSTVTILGNLIIKSTRTLTIDNFGELNINGEINSSSFPNSGMISTGIGSGDININGSGGGLFIRFLNASFNNFNVNTTRMVSIVGTLTVSNNFNFNVVGYWALAAGTTMSLDGPINFGNSLLRGSAGSIVIGGAGAITGGLRLEQGLVTQPFRNLTSLTLNRSGAVLNLLSDLRIVDFISAPNGTIACSNFVTLLSSASRSARVGQIGASAAITGNINVQTFVPGPSTGWALLGASGVNGQSISNWASQIPMTCNGCPNPTTSIPGGFASIQGWDEASENYVSNLTAAQALTPGRGFWVYVGSGQFTTTAFTLLNTGTAVQRAGVIPITKTPSVTNSYNLIANPYASPISFSALRAQGTNATKIANAIYGWNANLNGGAGGHVQFVNGISNPSGLTGMNDVIPKGQGFFVEALSSGNLDYNESIKSAANTNANPLLRAVPPALARLRLEGVNDADETVICHNANATLAFDSEFDARKIFQTPGYIGLPGPYTNYTSISTRINDVDFAINSFYVPTAPTTGTLAIPLLTKVSSTGSYTISAFDADNFKSCLLLKDKLTMNYHDIMAAPYVCYISDTTSVPRFELVVCERGKVVENPVGISEVTNLENIAIWGTGTTVNVILPTTQNAPANIAVYNLLGQMLVEKKTDYRQGGTTSIDVPGNSQVVLVKVSTDNSTSFKKVFLSN